MIQILYFSTNLMGTVYQKPLELEAKMPMPMSLLKLDVQNADADAKTI